ncbi:MAG: isoprenylcysteine carboxylmethyltransferase family protein [Lachnospiraceae bacterium]|nr:isoprenylcysteine carboxylmethyltransferase family protein [Lachnospiraceae bacterium]
MDREKKESINNRHLPMYGVGPLYVWICILVTVVAVILVRKGLLSSGGVEYTPVRNITIIVAIMFLFWILGIIFIIFGAAIWYAAVKIKHVDEYIMHNKLATTGIYAYVRNPIYSGVSIMLTGVDLLTENYWMLLLPVFYWVFLTILMICTEEKWLKKMYGEPYVRYCKRVNRCIPSFWKHHDRYKKNKSAKDEEPEVNPEEEEPEVELEDESDIQSE